MEELLSLIKKTGPVRINKYLSDSGICSRREADRLIEQGRVKIDGMPAENGQKVSGTQEVTVDGRTISGNDTPVLIAYNKPVGVECTTDLNNPDNIISKVGYASRIFPVGRLDKNSSGLILMTNIGELSDLILRGSNYHEKEYEVEVDRPVTDAFLRKMADGVEIELEDGQKRAVTRPCLVSKTGSKSFNVVLTQGLNRQIRRMCKSLGYNVVNLRRIRVMNIELGSLKPGKYRHVNDAEIRELSEQLQPNIK